MSRKLGVVFTGGNEGKVTDPGRASPRVTDESGKLVVSDRKPADEEFVEEHAMDRTLVVSTIGGAHQNLTRGDSREIRCA
jgi:hypothetical protein